MISVSVLYLELIARSRVKAENLPLWSMRTLSVSRFVAFNREDLAQHAFQAVVFTLFGRCFLLQECLVAFGLNLRQIGDDVSFASAAESARLAEVQTPLCGNGHKAYAPEKRVSVVGGY